MKMPFSKNLAQMVSILCEPDISVFFLCDHMSVLKTHGDSDTLGPPWELLYLDRDTPIQDCDKIVPYNLLYMHFICIFKVYLQLTSSYENIDDSTIFI